MQDWWDELSRDEQSEYLQNHPDSEKKIVGKPSDEEVIHKIKQMLSEPAQRSNEEKDKILSELNKRKQQKEEDIDELLADVESQRFEVKDPELKRQIEESAQVDDPLDDIMFLDQSPDFDIEANASGIIRAMTDQDIEQLGPPRSSPEIFHGLKALGMSLHQIMDMDEHQMTEMLTKDSDEFVRDVFENGFYKDPSRVAAQIVKSNTWKDWINRSKDDFIKSEILGD